jgi:hypothetical protein
MAIVTIQDLKDRAAAGDLYKDFQVDFVDTMESLINDKQSQIDYLTSILLSPAKLSGSSGNFSGTQTTYTDVTNLYLTINNNSLPVLLGLVHDGSLNLSYIGAQDITGTVSDLLVRIVRDTTVIAEYLTGFAEVDAGLKRHYAPPSIITVLDEPGAGVHDYKVQYKIQAEGTDTAIVRFCRLFARAMPVELT